MAPIFRLLQRLKYEFITSTCRQSTPLSITRTRLDNLTIIIQPTRTINYLTNYQVFFPHSHWPLCHSRKSCSTSNHLKRARYRPAVKAFSRQTRAFESYSQRSNHKQLVRDIIRYVYNSVADFKQGKVGPLFGMIPTSLMH